MTEVQEPYRIVLADDHRLIRQGLKSILRQDATLQVVAEAADGLELLDRLAKTPVDLVILDIAMPRMNGLEAVGLIHERFPQVKILILSMYRNVQYFYHTIAAGAHGYLIKDDSDSELMGAISMIRQGNSFVSPQLAAEVTGGMVDALREQRDVLSETKLSSREKQILQLVAQGLTSKEMADRLCLSPRTVDHHRAKLLKKFKMKNTADLINFVVSNNIIAPVS